MEGYSFLHLPISMDDLKAPSTLCICDLPLSGPSCRSACGTEHYRADCEEHCQCRQEERAGSYAVRESEPDKWGLCVRSAKEKTQTLDLV